MIARSLFHIQCRCTASRQCECACASYDDMTSKKLTDKHYTQSVSRRCECACETSNCQLDYTCTHTYHTQRVARQCVSSHDDHSLVSTCSYTNTPSSSTCACPLRVRFEEGREQTRAQRHLRGNTHKHKPTATEIFRHIQSNASMRCNSHALF